MLQTLQIEEILEHLSTVHHWNAMSIEVFHAHLKSFRRLRAVLLKCSNFRADIRSSLCLLLQESFEAWWMSNWVTDSSHWRIKSSLSGSLATLCWSVLTFLFCFSEMFQKSSAAACAEFYYSTLLYFFYLFDPRSQYMEEKKYKYCIL